MAKYVIKVESNPSFCGIDAGGVQFANGEAIVEESPLLNWFREHDGYCVEPIKGYDEAPAKEAGSKKKITAE